MTPELIRTKIASLKSQISLIQKGANRLSNDDLETINNLKIKIAEYRAMLPKNSSEIKREVRPNLEDALEKIRAWGKSKRG